MVVIAITILLVPNWVLVSGRFNFVCLFVIVYRILVFEVLFLFACLYVIIYLSKTLNEYLIVHVYNSKLN